jgi:hypothetical protein
MCQTDTGFRMNTTLVGAAMELRFVHPTKQTPIDIIARISQKDPGQSAHLRLRQSA